MAQAILPDPYWASMILGRVVHLHLGLVEPQLYQGHRDQVDAVLTPGGVTLSAITSLDATKPMDRLFARLLGRVSGGSLPETILLREQFVPTDIATGQNHEELSVLVYLDDPQGTVAHGIWRATRYCDELGLGTIIRLAVGMVGVDELPAKVRPACERECVLLTATQWRAPTPELAGLLLSAAAVSLARQWIYAEARAYGWDDLPPTVDALADDFAAGVRAEFLRRTAAPDWESTTADRPPTQEPILPLVSELVRCWWPAPGRARHIFGSPFDYMSTLEPIHARG